MKLNQMFAHWEQVRADLLTTVDRFSEEELTYSPYRGCWPVGKIMIHIADCEDYWLHAVVQPTNLTPSRHSPVLNISAAPLAVARDMTHLNSSIKTCASLRFSMSNPSVNWL